MRCFLISLFLFVLAVIGPGRAESGVYRLGSDQNGQVPSGATYRLVNLMPAFWTFWEQSRRLSNTDRIALFRKLVIQPRAGLYTQLLGEITDQRLDEYLRGLHPHIPAMKTLSRRFPEQLSRYRQHFRQRFPDSGPELTVYLLPSLYAFDGQARPVDGQLAVLFGADALAADGRTSPSRAAVEHEFFHRYHMQTAPEIKAGADAFFIRRQPPALFYLLWVEGLAVYASGLLNPDASAEDLLNSASLAAQARPLVPKLAKELRGKLNSTSFTDLQDFFFLGGRRQDIPARSGYFMGWLIAQELAKSRSLEELIRLQGDELNGQIDKVLQQLER